MPHIRKDRGQADLRRVETGTSSQHRIKSYIRYRVDVRISDDRALKVARVHPGRPAASRYDSCVRLPAKGKPVTKFPRRWWKNVS
ncbi:MAG: hypothetical protein U9N19_10050 [Thermodesulfobacteriota bacterium]|nr:hypothetical protein [Thermodesulfobacteriota bacterium]